MTDWQMEKLAGEAMGLKLDGVEGRDAFLWDADTCDMWLPISSDAQAMALVKRFHLHIDQRPGLQLSVQSSDFSDMVCYEAKRGQALDLNLAIVELVAKVHVKK